MINFGRVDKNIFVGNAPQTSVDVARLQQMKITSVVSLQSDDDIISHQIDWPKLKRAYDYNNIVVHRFPIIDFDEHDLGQRLPDPVTMLDKLLSVEHRVYVHCNAGVCRAPATVLTYLCHYQGLSLEQGLDKIRSERPQANPYIGAVERALNELGSKTEEH